MFASSKSALAAVTLAVAAVAAPLATATQAAAKPISGSCGGGNIAFRSSPIGLAAAPATATFTGDLTGCQGTPAPTGTFSGTFAGNGNCFDINGQIDGVVNWSDGRVSRVSGPWDVPGGMGAPKTNTVTITDGPGAGQRMSVSQGPIDGGSQVGPCLTDNVRDAGLTITNVQFS
ncbi:hypothetical protein [Nocardia crassostreae]|uniref:hypothetical protein n=1 Tax=Nocardia crassostreae TaxID=53428 RepID=UPI0008315B25|nr:hypothetical protein [Nocardia crassostreae]